MSVAKIHRWIKSKRYDLFFSFKAESRRFNIISIAEFYYILSPIKIPPEHRDI